MKDVLIFNDTSEDVLCYCPESITKRSGRDSAENEAIILIRIH